MKKEKSNQEEEMQAINIEKEVQQLFDSNNQQNIALRKIIEALDTNKTKNETVSNPILIQENEFKKRVRTLMNKILKRK
jgi:uridine phosphorylase